MTPTSPSNDEGAERWRPIDDWPAYEVSSRGRVHDTRTRRELRPFRASSTRPPLYVTLVDGSYHQMVRVDALVLHAFVGPPPSPDMQAHHRNGLHKDCTVGNLSWRRGRSIPRITTPVPITRVTAGALQEAYRAHMVNGGRPPPDWLMQMSTTMNLSVDKVVLVGRRRAVVLSS